MKKTLTVNLNGRVFNIDEDAYQLLDKYLRNLRIYFRKEEGCSEILADIEARIEELFNERVRLGYNVITIAEVEQVIAQVGRPGDFGEREDEPKEEKSAGYSAENFIHTQKKFYRNPDDKMFAGLCSGLAAYFGWNVVFVRVITAILVPVTSIGIVPAYLILWLLIPEAITAEQKLEMQGKPITVENIGKTVAAGVEDMKKTAVKSGCLTSFVDFIAAFFKVCLVALGLLIGAPLIFALMIVIIVLFAILFGVGTGVFGGWLPWLNTSFLFFDRPVLITICACFLIAIPLIALVYGIISNIFHLKPVHAGVKWAGIILWIAAVVALPFAGLKTDRKTSLSDRNESLPPVQSVVVEKHLVGDLQIEQISGDSAFLFINGDANLLDKVKVKMQSNNTLSLSTDDYYRFRPTSTLKIRLQTPDPKSVKVFSVGNVSVLGTLRTHDFSIYTEGAGKIFIDDLNVELLNVLNEGVGSISLAGIAKNTHLELRGVGNIDALELLSDSVEAKVNGVGSIQCNPVEHLTGTVNGVGTISYKSEPKSKNATTNGLGTIKLE